MVINYYMIKIIKIIYLKILFGINLFFKNKNKKLIKVCYSERNQFIINSVYRTGEHGSLYKDLNAHLVSLASIEYKSNINILHIYLFDSITGRLLLHHYHKNIDINKRIISMLLFSNKFISEKIGILYNTIKYKYHKNQIK